MNVLSIVVLPTEPTGVNIKIGGDGVISGTATISPIGGAGNLVDPLSIPGPSVMRATRTVLSLRDGRFVPVLISTG